MPNSRLKIVGDEFLTSIDYQDEFNVNLLFDRSIYRQMCTHMGHPMMLSCMSLQGALWSFIVIST